MSTCVAGVEKLWRGGMPGPRMRKGTRMAWSYTCRRVVGMVWYGMVWQGMVWVWYGMLCYGMVWYGMVWYGMVWYGMVWCGMVRDVMGGEGRVEGVCLSTCNLHAGRLC
jgi:hypothetical protein